MPENDRKAIDDALAEAREALKGEDIERMKRAQESLSQAAHKLAEIMYREAQAQGQPRGPSAPGGQSQGAPGPKEGEVVDATSRIWATRRSSGLCVATTTRFWESRQPLRRARCAERISASRGSIRPTSISGTSEPRALRGRSQRRSGCLGDAAARQMYDQYGHAPGSRPRIARRGGAATDVHAVVDLSFAEVARGASVRLDVQRYSACTKCGASGAGREGRCSACQGRGVRRVVEPVDVVVPAGVDSGAQIRVAGEGNAGPFGGPRGDLIVSTRVGEHPFFQRKGDSVHCDVPISVWEALLGARIRVPTPSARLCWWCRRGRRVARCSGCAVRGCRG